jgi:hypothetical protein
MKECKTDIKKFINPKLMTLKNKDITFKKIKKIFRKYLSRRRKKVNEKLILIKSIF